jgi:hypothetical protein
MAAFTATATPEVRADIVQLLGLATPRVIVAGFDRPNIHPAVRPVSGEVEKQRLLPGLVRDRRALVYAATRARAETAGAVLQGAGIDGAARPIASCCGRSSRELRARRGRTDDGGSRPCWLGTPRDCPTISCGCRQRACSARTSRG